MCFRRESGYCAICFTPSIQSGTATPGVIAQVGTHIEGPKPAKRINIVLVPEHFYSIYCEFVTVPINRACLSLRTLSD